MKNTHRIPLLACSLLFSACALPYRGIVLPTEYGGPKDWQQGGRYRETQAGQPVVDPSMSATPAGGELYGWDGGVVDAQPQGRVVPEDRTRGIEPPPTGRMHIIELYQQVLEERDGLLKEVDTLKAALRQSEEQLHGERGGTGSLQAQIEALRMEIQRLLNQNQELGARLTTAQIRRLEAEKLLLELRINSHRKESRPMDSVGGGQ